MRHFQRGVLVSLFVCLGACDHAKATEAPLPTPASPPPTVAAIPSQSVPPAAPRAIDSANPVTALVELKIESVANTMAFNLTKLTVPAGSRVHLVFTNNSTMTALPHNWVLVRPGTEAAVAAANVDKVAAGYISPMPDVLASTPLAIRGATTEVTFQAPPIGTYPFICTVPGHYMMMKGELVVTP